jgi:hypothetical protein
VFPVTEQQSANETTVLTERPLVSVAVVAGTAAGVWVGISLALRDTVDPVETALFAAVFAVVYVGSHYL